MTRDHVPDRSGTALLPRTAPHPEGAISPLTKPESAGYDYDVVISGAGLAGSAAAVLLARRGVRVALLERRSDPEAYKLPDKKRLPAFREDLEGSFLEFVRALPEAPPIDSAERVTKIIGTVNYPLHSRKPTAPGVAFVGDAALTGDPLWGVGCGWALQSAQWLAEAIASAATGRGDLDRSLGVYARRHRRRLRGHQYLAADFAKARPFNPLKRLMYSAAARDESVARHMYLFASRLIGPLRFLNPVVLARATAVNIKHRGAAVPLAHLSRTGS